MLLKWTYSEVKKYRPLVELEYSKVTGSGLANLLAVYLGNKAPNFAARFDQGSEVDQSWNSNTMVCVMPIYLRRSRHNENFQDDRSSVR